MPQEVLFIDNMKLLVCVLVLIAGASAAPGGTGGRIIGGAQAPRGLYKFIVSAQYCNAAGNCQHSCGGTILTETWVLTAAHCITEVSPAGYYLIRAGITYLNDTHEGQQTIRVIDHVIHEDYTGGVAPHDLALFKLEESIRFSDLIAPAKLPSKGEAVTGAVYLAGWGSIGTIIIFPIMPNELQHVEMPIMPTSECDRALSDILGSAPHPLDLYNNICTGSFDQATSACNGDSGGPLVKGDTVYGVVSWGINPCGTAGAPSVYVSVAQYIDWINRHIEN